MKVPTLTLSSVPVKICQILDVIFQNTIRFLSSFALLFSAKKDNSSVLGEFSLERSNSEKVVHYGAFLSKPYNVSGRRFQRNYV